MRRGFRHRAGFAVSAALVAFLAVPLVFLLIRAWSSGAAPMRAVLSSDETWWALARTLALGLGLAAASVAIALPLAWLTHATDLPLRRFFRIALNLPLAVPSYVGAFVVLLVFAPGGWVYSALQSIGIDSPPDIYGAPGAVMALLFSYPFALLVLQASLARLDPRLWESARSLGKSPTAAFFRVVVPALRPAMASGGLLVALYAVGDFGAVSLMRFKSLSYLTYLRYKSLFGRHEAIAVALLLVAAATLLVVLLLLARGRSRRALTTFGERRKWPTIALGRWRWLAFAACAAIVLLFVALPVGTVLLWLVRGVLRGHDITLPWGETLRSLALAVAAAVAIVGCALIPTVLARHFSIGSSRTVSLFAHVGYALPGIVVAISIVAFVTASAMWLYQTVALLLIAYLIRFFPLALHALDDALASQNKNLVRAARSLGAGPLETCRRVILPNLRPAIFAGGLAAMVAVLKELPVTLLLSPTEFPTLATEIWSLTEDAYFSAAAPAVLIMIGLGALGLLLSPAVRRRDA